MLRFNLSIRTHSCSSRGLRNWIGHPQKALNLVDSRGTRPGWIDWQGAWKMCGLEFSRWLLGVAVCGVLLFALPH